METRKKYLEEYPNMSYASEIGMADLDFERKFAETLKKEFTGYLDTYLFHIRRNEPRAASEIVYKLKFKLSILRMNNAVVFAEFYGDRLRVGDMSLADDFKRILRRVDTFLSSL